jgi:hypothetical protein
VKRHCSTQVEPWSVHQRHERDHRVEAPVRERREVGVRRTRVLDPERRAPLFFLRQRDHALREIDTGHAGAATGEDAGVVSFAAPGVEHAPAVQVADEGEERRIVEPFAGDVGPAANLLGPRSGVSVPVARHVLDGEIVAHPPT